MIDEPDKHRVKWSDLSRIGADRLLSQIAKEHNLLHPKSILDKTRSPRIVEARDHFLAVLRWSTTLSFPELGRLLDMDHTSVMHAVKRHERVVNGETRYEYDEEKNHKRKVARCLK